MPSDKTSKKTSKNGSESGISASAEKSLVNEKTASLRTPKSSLSKSEPVETSSAKRHRKAATVAAPEMASQQPVSNPKAMAAAAGDTTVAVAVDPVGVDFPTFSSAKTEVPRERIQELAYQLWIADGKPYGNHHEHWLRAERELGLIH